MIVLPTKAKPIGEKKKVMKILGSLPSKWHTKVTTIQEAKDLTLIGSLMTYEINLAKKQQEGEDKKKKLKKKNKVKKNASKENSKNSCGMKGLEEDGSLLE